jgi:hypothetical protein
MENKIISTQDLFDEIKNFERDNHYTECKTTKQMALSISKIGDFSYRNNSMAVLYCSWADLFNLANI